MTVNSVYMDPAVGGDGNTYDDGTSSTTGLDNGGHRKRLIPLFSAVLSVAQFLLTQAGLAQGYATSALNAPGTSATCPTTLTVPSSFPTILSFTLGQTGKLFTKGQTLVFSDNTDPTIQFLGVLIAFVSGTGVGQISVQQAAGAGSLSNWNVALGSPINGTLTGRVGTLETNETQEQNDRLFFSGEMF